MTGCSINSGNGTEGSDTWIINKGGSNPILGGFFFCTSNSVTGLQTVFEMTGTGNANFNAINDVPTAYYDATSSIQTQLDSKTTTTEMMGRANTWTAVNNFNGGFSTASGTSTSIRGENNITGDGIFPVANTGASQGVSFYMTGGTGATRILNRAQGGVGGFTFHSSNASNAPNLLATLTNTGTPNTAVFNCGVFSCPPVVNSRKIVMYDSGNYSFFGLGVESGVSRYNVIYNATHRFSNANSAGNGFEDILSVNRALSTFVSPVSLPALTFTNSVSSNKLTLFSGLNNFDFFGLGIEGGTLRYNNRYGDTHRFSNSNASGASATGFTDLLTINRALTTCLTPFQVSSSLTVTGTSTLATVSAGAVTLTDLIGATKTMVGLTNVDDTSDLTKKNAMLAAANNWTGQNTFALPIYTPGQAGAYLLNGDIFAQNYPIYNSTTHYTDFWPKSSGTSVNPTVGSIYGSYITVNNLDDAYQIMPNFRLIVYDGTVYTGSITLDCYNTSKYPIFVVPTSPNLGSSCKLYFVDTEIV